MTEFDIGIVSDLHKEVYGYRPGPDFWTNWKGSTPEEKCAIIDGLNTHLEVVIKEEQAAEARAIVEFEAQIKSNIALGATDRQQAVKWIIESLNDPWDAGHVCFKLGLPYSMENEFEFFFKKRSVA